MVDTGILPHPDLAGRVLPGYDFISDAVLARDGNARDPNPRDEGDWSNGECGPYSEPSFFHGLFVAGIIAANANNGIGIAGIAAGADIVPVRVLGTCGGTFEDIFAGVLWASGVNIAGVPANQNPAKIINLSLGGFGPCDQSIQEAVDDALAHGAVVVVAAGNSSLEACGFRACQLQRRHHRRRARPDGQPDELLELRHAHRPDRARRRRSFRRPRRRACITKGDTVPTDPTTRSRAARASRRRWSRAPRRCCSRATAC